MRAKLAQLLIDIALILGLVAVTSFQIGFWDGAIEIKSRAR